MITALPQFPADALGDLCRKYQVRELSLFGSTVRGEQTAGSDLDFLVEFEPQARIGFLSLSGLQRELSALTQRPVDLVPKAGLKQTIRAQVLAEAKLIYAAHNHALKGTAREPSADNSRFAALETSYQALSQSHEVGVAGVCAP